MRLIYALIFLFSSSTMGLADGGAVQLRESVSPFIVTVFADPPQCRAGQLDLSALVQEEKTGDPVLDAVVMVSLSAAESAKTTGGAAWLPPACINNSAANLQEIPLQVSSGANRLYYSSLVQIPYDGRWQLQVNVQRGAEHVAVQGIMEVHPALPPVTAYWQWFLLPFLAIAGFVLHQHIRKQRKLA
jgi:hypothetical protein